jgi:hypothetical protein
MAEAERSSRDLLYRARRRASRALVASSMTRSKPPWEPGAAAPAASRRRGPGVRLGPDQEHDREENQKDGKRREVNGCAKG